MLLLGSCGIHFGQVFVFSQAFAKSAILVLRQVFRLVSAVEELAWISTRAWSVPQTFYTLAYLGYSIPAIAFTVYS